MNFSSAMQEMRGHFRRCAHAQIVFGHSDDSLRWISQRMD